MKILEKEKDNFKLEVDSVDESMVHLLITELLKNEDVKEATYFKRYPEEDKLTISLHMKKGRPLVAVKRAAENLSKDFKKYRESVKKGRKSKK